MPHSFHFQAMSLNVPTVPPTLEVNRTPWCGTLTLVDTPSRNAPMGSSGHRVLLPRATAEAALPSLLGMPVNCATRLDTHAPMQVIGLITHASIEGQSLTVSGWLYEKNQSDLVAMIRKRQGELGMSFEISGAEIDNLDAEVWTITRCAFSGGSILLKSAAAFGGTSLAAHTEESNAMDAMMKKLDAVNRSLATATAMHQRQARVPLVPPPVRATRVWHERDAEVQREEPWLSPIARAARELQARGLAPLPATAWSPAPHPDHRQHQIDWDEQVYVGNGCTVRRGDMGRVQLSDGLSVAERLRQADMRAAQALHAARAGNGAQTIDPATATIAQPVEPGQPLTAVELAELDTANKAAGMSLVQRMAEELRHRRPLM